MVAGNEIARMITDFECKTISENKRHHEQIQGFQESFKKDMQSVISTFKELVNPFSEESEGLIAVDTKDVMCDAVVKCTQK